MRRNWFVRFTLAFLVLTALALPARVSAVRAPDDDNLQPIPQLSGEPLAIENSGADSPLELEDVDVTPDPLVADSAVSALDDLMRKAACEAGEKRSLTDEFGRRHVRMGQYHKGIPVFGGDVTVHRNPEGRVERISGKMLRRITCDTTPAIEPDVALQIGLDELAGKPGLKVTMKPSLVIFGSRLGHRFVIEHGGDNPGKWDYIVCAHSGQILQRYNDIKFAAPARYGTYGTVYGERVTGEGGTQASMPVWQDTTGDYFLYHKARRWGIYDTKTMDWEHQNANDWQAKDRAAVSCAKNLSLTQAWVKNVLKRNSFDNLGGFAQGNIHEGTNYVNAYWDGRSLHFGDGDGIRAGEMVSLDIVAHEFGHAVTQYTSDLVYSGESGALNESYSDIMACAVEWHYQPKDMNGAPGYSDWLIGEDAWLSSPALRDMRNPKNYGQPSYYKGQYWETGTADNGGVHTNSGVQNFAFYLLAQGGAGTNEGRSYNIAGLGVAAASKVAMRANMVYLTSTAKFLDSRRAWVRAASDLGYPTTTVMAVWDAVGVFDPQA